GSTITVEQGQASFIVGGDAAALERVRPWLLAMGTAVTHVGPLGLAKTLKGATNLGLAVQMLAFSEAVVLAEEAGIARDRAVGACGGGAAQVRDRFADGEVPRAVRAGADADRRVVQGRHDPEGPAARAGRRADQRRAAATDLGGAGVDDGGAWARPRRLRLR